MPKTNLSNSEIVALLGLPDDIIDTLQVAQGDTFSAAANQFLSALVNKICYQKLDRMSFSNPFKKFESFPVRYGDTIENIYVEIPKGYVYDKDATDPFTKSVPNVKALYATINFEMQYPATIQDVLLRRAALNEYGFMQIIEGILASLGTRKDVDEYTATINMLNNKEFSKLRFLPDLDYDQKCDYLVNLLGDSSNRGAQFVDCMCFIDENGNVYNYKGINEGTIAYKKAGHEGFGYDPIFVVNF